jgi:hypothetical protein
MAKCDILEFIGSPLFGQLTCPEVLALGVAAGGSTGTDILLDSEQTYTYKTGISGVSPSSQKATPPF